jgi:hypothetical protein
VSLKVHLWNIAGDVFNMREAKRLFGLIAVGGTLVTPLACCLVSALPLCAESC